MWPSKRRNSKLTILHNAHVSQELEDTHVAIDTRVADNSCLRFPCPCLSFNFETERMRAAVSCRQAAVALTVFAISIRFAERDRCKVFCSIPLPWLLAPPSWLTGDLPLEQSISGLLTSSDEVVSSDIR